MCEHGANHSRHWEYSGFGRLTIETLSRQGYRVFAGMRAAAGKNAPAAEELRALAQRERLALQIIEIDVTDDASVERALAAIIETTGRLDVVVNNAGVSYSGPLEAFTLEQVRQQFETNVFSVLRVNRAVLPQMREQGSGLLLQIGSIAGRLALPFLGLYGATKFALEGLTESYRYELEPFGIDRSEEHTSELQSQSNLVCRLLLEKKKKIVEASTPTSHT